MAKAVLIIDMPENCTECPAMGMFYGFHSCKNVCEGVGRPDWCPLRGLPERENKMTDADDLGRDYVRGTMDGWNACLDALLAEK